MICLKPEDIENTRFPLEGENGAYADVVRVSRLKEILKEYRELILQRPYYVTLSDLDERFGVLFKED